MQRVFFVSKESGRGECRSIFCEWNQCDLVSKETNSPELLALLFVKVSELNVGEITFLINMSNYRKSMQKKQNPAVSGIFEVIKNIYWWVNQIWTHISARGSLIPALSQGLWVGGFGISQQGTRPFTERFDKCVQKSSETPPTTWFLLSVPLDLKGEHLESDSSRESVGRCKEQAGNSTETCLGLWLCLLMGIFL